MLIELQEKLKEKIGPILVTTEVEYVDQTYFLTFDGTETYPNAERSWDWHWLSGFDGFCRAMLRQHNLKVQGSEEVTPTRIRYNVGTLLDMLKEQNV